jgi:hypothetical protein
MIGGSPMIQISKVRSKKIMMKTETTIYLIKYNNAHFSV